MKKLLLHIILFSYAIVMFKPAFPYLEDFIGHALYYKQHMATMHFENGEYHVHKEIAKIEKEDNSNKNSLPEKKKNTTDEYNAGTLNKATIEYSFICGKAYGIHMQQEIYTPYLPYNYPPPRV